MKKLMILFCAVAVAGLSHAATYTWGSGALMTAASKDGGWGSAYVNKADALVTMKIYVIDATTYDSLASKSMKDLYDSYSTQSASLTGQNKNPSTDALINAVTIKETDAPDKVQYAVVIATYTDATYGDMYIANRIAATYTDATKTGKASNTISGVGSGWAPVPEPTSGLLMLVGLAGLALRRKRA